MSIEKAIRYDELYLDIATRISRESTALRYKVGCVLVEEKRVGNIVSFGWNGMPSGMDNRCEIDCDGNPVDLEMYYGKDMSIHDLRSKSDVSHAEINMIAKTPPLDPTSQYTLYLTHEPCHHCAEELVQKLPQITRVVYRYVYAPDPNSSSHGKLPGGDVLRSADIRVQHLS